MACQFLKKYLTRSKVNIENPQPDLGFSIFTLDRNNVKIHFAAESYLLL